MRAPTSAPPSTRSEEELQRLHDGLVQLPKVELHAHLNGCIRESTLFDLAAERGVTLSEHHFEHHPAQRPESRSSVGNPPLTESSSSSMVHEHHPQHGAASAGLLYNHKPRSLQDCFALFAEIPAAVNDLVALRRIVREALEDFAAAHVVYLELRSTPKCLLVDSVSSSFSSALDKDDASTKDRNQQATKQDYVETIESVMRDFMQQEQARWLLSDEKAVTVPVTQSEEGMEDGQPRMARPPLTCRLILSVDRSQPVAQGLETIELAIRMNQQPDSLVVGVDLGGNPTKQDFADFRGVFAKARAAGLCVTLHCAEVSCGDDEPGDDETTKRAYQEASAMLEFQPDRLGHALLLPPSLQRRLAELQIPVETCPTSNVMTLELAHRARGDLVHALATGHVSLADWLQTKYPLAICTDDPGVFETTPTQELLLVAMAFGLQHDDMTQLVLQSIRWAFCDVTTRETIATCMEQRLAQLQSYRS